MQSLQMFPYRTQFKAAHNQTALFKTRPIFPTCALSFQHSIQANWTKGNQKIREQSFGMLVSLVPRLSTLDYRNLNPHTLTVGVKPAAPWKGMELQLMDLSAQRTGMARIQEVAKLDEFV